MATSGGRSGRAVTEEEYESLLPGMPNITETNENAAILTADDYFAVIRKRDTRPAFWKLGDVKSVLEKMGDEPLCEAERRYCTMVNTDAGEMSGATPSIFIGWQLIHPGEVVPPHRHNSVAIYHILQGTGYTAVQSAGDEWAKYHWERGDTLACPAWAYHAHYAEGEEDILMYVVQDMPALAANRTLFWEEPMGQENVRHQVLGTSESWSVTRNPGSE
jgi:gentisate 1,2-dioxygenase